MYVEFLLTDFSFISQSASWVVKLTLNFYISLD